MKLRLSKTRPLLLKLIKLNKILVRQNQQSKIKMFNFRMLKLRLLKLKIKLTNKLGIVNSNQTEITTQETDVANAKTNVEIAQKS